MSAHSGARTGGAGIVRRPTRQIRVGDVPVAGGAPVTVVVRRTSTGLRLAVDAPVVDRTAHPLRARAVGATLLATRDFATLHLPLTAPVPSPLAEDLP